MTLHRSVSVTTFGVDSAVTTNNSDDHIYNTLPSKQTPSVNNSRDSQFSPPRPLRDRPRSSQTFSSRATYSSLSRQESVNSHVSRDSVFQSQNSFDKSRTSVDQSQHSLRRSKTSVDQSQYSLRRSKTSIDQSQNSLRRSRTSVSSRSRNSVSDFAGSDYNISKSPPTNSFNAKFHEACNRRTPLTSTSSSNRKRSHKSEENKRHSSYNQQDVLYVNGEENKRPHTNNRPETNNRTEKQRCHSRESFRSPETEFYRQEKSNRRGKDDIINREREDIERFRTRSRDESPTRSQSNSKGTKDSGVSHLNSTESQDTSPTRKSNKRSSNIHSNNKTKDLNNHKNHSKSNRSKSDNYNHRRPSVNIDREEEVLLEFPDPMPRSVGRTAARQLERSRGNVSSHNTPQRSHSGERLNTRLQSAKSEPGLNQVGRNRYARATGEVSPKSSANCGLWFLFKRKKKDKDKDKLNSSRTPDKSLKSSQLSNSDRKLSRTPLYYQEYYDRNRSTSPVSRSERREGSRGRSIQQSAPSGVSEHSDEDERNSPPLSNKAFKNCLSPSVHSSPLPPHSDKLYQPSTSSNRATLDPHGTPHHRHHTTASRTHSVDNDLSSRTKPSSSPHATKRAIIKAASTPANLSEAAKRQSRSEVSLSRTGAGVSGYSSASNLRDSDPDYDEDEEEDFTAYGSRPFDKYSKNSRSVSRLDAEATSQFSEERPRSEPRSRSGGRPRGQGRARTDSSSSNPVHPSIYLADTKVINDAENFVEDPSLDMSGAMHLSFCGCGFLGMYHLGVISTLMQRGGPLLSRVEKVAGASAGALSAALLVTAGDRLEESAEHLQYLAKEIRRKPLGALTPGYSFTKSLRHMMEDVLPDDAHRLARNRLYISLTNYQTKKNEILSDFTSREELIEALIASCYIPVYAGVKLPSLRGKKFMDGGLTDNLPRFETGRTITVSPFDGKTDICPKKGEEVEKKSHFITLHNQDIQVNMKNVKRGSHAFFPPKRGFLQDYYVKGRDDATRFLIREGLYEINMPQKKPPHYESSV